MSQPQEKSYFAIGAAGILLMLVVLSFLIQAIEQDRYYTASEVAFAVHPLRYSIPLYHWLAAPLFLATLFLGRYWLQVGCTLFYSSFHIYSLWTRTQGCYFGEDLCPPVSIGVELLERAHWVDGIAALFLAMLFVTHLTALIRIHEAGEMPK